MIDSEKKDFVKKYMSFISNNKTEVIDPEKYSFYVFLQDLKSIILRRNISQVIRFILLIERKTFLHLF